MESFKQIVFVDGRTFRGGEACIPADDLGVQRAYAVFDYARFFRGRPFHIEDHLARFRHSAAQLRLNLAYSDKEIIEQATAMAQDIAGGEAGLRLILTGGSAHAPVLLEKPRFIMIVEQLPSYPARIYEDGVKLVTYEFQRALPRVKTTNYMNAFRLEPLKREAQAFDILYHSNGRVLECPRDNFLLFHGDTLITAGADVLEGVTRRIILSLARERYGVEERVVNLAELDTADEAFMTSTTKGVLPVVRIDTREVGAGRVGARTRTLMAAFRRYLAEYR
jgi:branched-chain amino acid aminotransferase